MCETLAMMRCPALTLGIDQGPNRANQQILLSSNFFAAVNRLLCSITYTPQVR